MRLLHAVSTIHQNHVARARCETFNRPAWSREILADSAVQSSHVSLYALEHCRLRPLRPFEVFAL